MLPVTHSGGFRRPWTAGLALVQCRAAICKADEAQLEAEGSEGWEVAGVSVHPGPSQMEAEAGFEEHWRSEPKLGVALGHSLDIASILSFPLPFGQALLCILCPEYRTAAAGLSGFVPRPLAHALPAWSASPLLHRRLPRIHLG